MSVAKLYRTVSALTVVSALVLTGCNTGGSADTNDETGSLETPAAEDTDLPATEDEGAAADQGGDETEDAGDAAPAAAGELTQPGTTLGAGEPATVLASTSDSESTIEVTVSEPRAGDRADLAKHEVPEEVKDHVPHYLDVSVTNVGDGNLGNGSIRVRGLTSGGQRIIAAVVTRLDQCEGESFPSDFTNGDSIETCFLFMLPEGDSLIGAEYVDFDRAQGDDPITWMF